MSSYPSPAGDIRNSNAVTDQEAMRRLAEVVIHGAVQTAGFVAVAVDSVLNLFRCISYTRLVGWSFGGLFIKTYS